MHTIFTSLPVRGAWIEIRYFAHHYWWNHGRSPCGERGLKSPHQGFGDTAQQSLPVRGAWIEIKIPPS